MKGVGNSYGFAKVSELGKRIEDGAKSERPAPRSTPASANTPTTSRKVKSSMNDCAPRRHDRAGAYRVLVVDDDPDMAAFLARLLAAARA